MIEVNAAILEQSLDVITTKLQAVDGIVDVAQIDVCDGSFVPTATYLSFADVAQADTLSALIHCLTCPVELDMMVSLQTIDDIDKWIAVLQSISPARIVLHRKALSSELAGEILDALHRDVSISEIGLALHLDELPSVHPEIFALGFDYIQVMGILEVGRGGQSFTERALDLIAAVRTMYPTVPISVDGGVKLDNAERIVHSGATRLTIGSGLYDATDVAARVSEFRQSVAQ